MKKIEKLILLSTFFLSAFSYAANFDSSYTSIAEKDCKLIASSEHESSQSCQKFGMIEVSIGELNSRQSLFLQRNGKDYPLDFWDNVTMNFSTLGKKIEWRHTKGNPNDIVGMIVRLNVSENTEKPSKTVSYLVVSKITKDEMCVVGKLAPQNKQNEHAHKMAEQSSKMSCLFGSNEETNANEICDENGHRYTNSTQAKKSGLKESEFGATYCPEYKMHASWDVDNDGKNDCYKDNSCVAGLDYMSPRKNNTSTIQNFVKGNVVYTGQTSLPENIQVSVKINDVSLADVASVTIGEYKTSGASSFPIPFKISYLPSKIKQGFIYSVSARIEKDGKLLFINDTRIPVFQNGKTDNRGIRLPVIKIKR